MDAVLASAPDYSFDSARREYREERIAHWDQVALKGPGEPMASRHYRQQIAKVYQFLVAPGQRVLELGCGRGDLLAAVQPASGMGLDFSAAMIEQARQRHPHLTFIQADVHEPPLAQPFDVVILSDLVNDIWDVQTVLNKLHPLLTPRSRVIMNYHSRAWQWPLALARKAGLARSCLTQNWLTTEDLVNLLQLTDFEPIRHTGEILCPVQIPGISTLCNRWLARLWPWNMGAVANFLVARQSPAKSASRRAPKVSVIVPARNEAGNIADIFKRVPDMGRETELVFVEGHSSDDTYARIEEEIRAHPERHCQLHRQTGKGKGDAVRLGFAKASGDVLMILDSDLSVPPEDLPRFYDALVSGKGEFINGVRLVYPMQKKAMRFCNLIGNKFFSQAFTWLLGQSIKDSLCGTKVLWRHDYDLIAANRSYFGDFDPFGDFDLLFGAAKQTRKIIDLPIRYRERTYGSTSIQRWRHGWLLLRMVAFAARRFKFV